MFTTAPETNRLLQKQIADTLARWLRYCPLQRHEYLRVSAENGEVRLSGLVCHTYPVEEIIHFLEDMPGVRHVCNEVTRIYMGRPVTL